MKVHWLWRMAAMLLMLTVMPWSSARAQESGAALVADGTTTATVGGQRIAAGRQREMVTLGGTGFDAGEIIGLWVTLPDGSVLGLDDDTLRADSRGAFALELGLGSGLPTGLHRFSARGQRSGRGAIVPFVLLAGSGPAVTEGTRLTLSPAIARQLDTIDLIASGFSANEMIALWLTLPDGSVVGLGNAQADANGLLGGSLFLPGALPVGRHYFTARGVSSGNTAIAPFVLQYGNGLNVPGARLAADLGRVPQRSALELSIAGESFTPNESISFWLTLPNGAVLDLGEVKADSSGNLEVVLNLDESFPTGTHYLSFRSNVSEQGGFLKLFLAPGPQDPGRE